MIEEYYFASIIQNSRGPFCRQKSGGGENDDGAESKFGVGRLGWLAVGERDVEISAP